MTADFDWKFYIKLYDDLIINNINTEEKALNHWNNIGKNENRICNKNIENFNWKKYILLNPDLKQHNINNKESAVIHWLTKGIYENRIIENIEENIENIEKNIENIENIEDNTENFDWKFYIKLYSDLSLHNINTEDSAFKHWATIGKNENRVCNKNIKNFNWEQYLLLNPDLKENNIHDEESAVIHWLTKGIYENRIIEKIIEEKIIEEKIIEEKIIKEKVIKKKVVEEKVIKKKVVEEKVIEEKVVEEKVVEEKVIEEKVVEEKVVEEKVIEEKVVEEKVVEEKVVEEKVVEEKVVEEKAFEEKAFEEKAFKEKVIEEKFIEEDLDEEDLDEKDLDEEDLDEEDLDEEDLDEEDLDEEDLINEDLIQENIIAEHIIAENIIIENNKINVIDNDDFSDELFDWEFYINYYDDLKKVINNKEEAFEHWTTKGKLENRYYNIYSFINNNKNFIKHDFDWKYYIEKYKDLSLDILNEKSKEFALKHWILIGKNEGRYLNKDLENNFDWIFYKNNIVNKNINSKEKALSHYYNHGIDENISYKNNKLKYSIIILYDNQKTHLLLVLNRFEKIYKNNFNYEVIIIDNNSDEENKLSNTIFDNYSFDIKYLYLENYNINSSTCYNKAFNFISGDIVIIQNALSYHSSNILENIKDIDFNNNFYMIPIISSSSDIDDLYILNKFNNYILCSEFKNNEEENFIKLKEKINLEDIIEYLENKSYNYKYSISKGWIDHHKYLNDNFNDIRCMIISKKNLDILDGFNETYYNDHSYEYDEFLHRVKKILNINYLESSFIINLFYDSTKNIQNISTIENIENNLKYDDNILYNLNINKKKYEQFIKNSKNHISWKTYENSVNNNTNHNHIYYNNFNIEILQNNKNTDNTFITFIIPTIGRKSLTNTINSLLNLNNKNWKAFIIFDGIENNFNINDTRISIIEIYNNNYKINRQSFIRNIGLKNTNNTGWIAFIDDDDYISPDYIDCFINELTENDDLEVCIFRMGYKNKFIIPTKYDTTITKCKIGISFLIREYIGKEIFFKDELFEEYLYLKELENNKCKIIISQYVTYFVKTEPYESEKYKRVLINF
jgi:hypothetical protein